MRLRAFTLIEVLVIMVILGLFASIAVPVYLNYRGDAEQSSEEAVVGAVRSAIYNHHLNAAAAGNPGFPSTLDSAAPGSQSQSNNPFFGDVLSSPVIDGWQKSGDALTYLSPGGTTYVYDPATGRFGPPGGGIFESEDPPPSPDILDFIDQQFFTAGEDETGKWYATGYSVNGDVVHLDHASNNWQRRSMVMALDMPEAGTYDLSLDYRYTDYHKQLHYWQVIGIKDGTTMDLASTDFKWGTNLSGTEIIHREYSRDGEDENQWQTYGNQFEISEDIASQYDRILISLTASRRPGDIAEWRNVTTTIPGGSSGP